MWSRYKKEIALILVTLAVLFVVPEILLRISDFRYYPVESGFKASGEYRIFKREDGRYVTSPSKVSHSQDFRDGYFIYQEFPVEKDGSAFRIFVLGGSSVNYLGKFGGLREHLMNILPPDMRPEIINVGGLAHGTERLLLHFREILRYDPDLIILYSGHNEFLEEYMKKAFYRDGPLDRLNRKLLRTSRSYQFLSFLVIESGKKIAASGIEKAEREGKPVFPAELVLSLGKRFDKEKIYSNYRRNVAAMIEMALNNGVYIIISTVAYNRADPPFDPADRSCVLYARELGLDGVPEHECCDSLETVTTGNKSADYPRWCCRLGIELMDKGNYEAASEFFEIAAAADLKPLRANRISNGIIKDLAHTYEVPLADVDGAIVSRSKAGIPGYDLFDDHCHLNERGNDILEAVLYETIRSSGIIE